MVVRWCGGVGVAMLLWCGGVAVWWFGGAVVMWWCCGALVCDGGHVVRGAVCGALVCDGGHVVCGVWCDGVVMTFCRRPQAALLKSGIELAYDTWGDASDPCVLFIAGHGYV